MQTTSFTATSATSVILAAALLFGCGGSGSSGSSPGGSVGAAAHGSLTIAGSGAAATGSEFPAHTRLGIGGAGITTTQWYNIDLAAGTTYPYVVLIIYRDDASGAVTTVTLSRMVDANNASDQWLTQTAPTPLEVSANAAGVTFTNLTVPGYANASTTTSLTLNGTLSF